jgi:hypothetical protein
LTEKESEVTELKKKIVRAGAQTWIKSRSYTETLVSNSKLPKGHSVTSDINKKLS